MNHDGIGCSVHVMWLSDLTLIVGDAVSGKCKVLA